MSGMLYLVPTPIGNLGDISQRCRATLENADFIATELLKKGKGDLYYRFKYKTPFSFKNVSNLLSFNEDLKEKSDGFSFVLWDLAFFTETMAFHPLMKKNKEFLSKDQLEIRERLESSLFYKYSNAFLFYNRLQQEDFEEKSIVKKRRALVKDFSKKTLDEQFDAYIETLLKR